MYALREHRRIARVRFEFEFAAGQNDLPA